MTKPIPTKQLKKGVKGDERPLREYDTMGWREANQSGRLIYDPVGDVFYLTVQHYKGDEAYFRIVAPRRPPAGPVDDAAPGGVPAVVAPGGDGSGLSADSIRMLAFVAWEEVAADINRMASAPAPEQPQQQPAPGRVDPAAATRAKLGEHTVACARELHALRQLYLSAVAEAIAKKSGKPAPPATPPRKKKPGPTAKAVAPTSPSISSGDDREWATFTWRGATFVVDSRDKYIGFLHKGRPVTEKYPEDSSIGDMARLFSQCMASSSVENNSRVSWMLAALVAEVSRHPTAVLEALFAVSHDAQAPTGSAFTSSSKAYKGKALPMSTGGTIGNAEGVPATVMEAETQSAIAFIEQQSGKAWDKVVLECAGRTRGQIVDAFKRMLFRALAGDEKRTLMRDAARKKAAGAKSRTATDGADSGESTPVPGPPAQTGPEPVGGSPEPGERPDAIDPDLPPDASVLPSQTIVGEPMPHHDDGPARPEEDPGERHDEDEEWEIPEELQALLGSDFDVDAALALGADHESEWAALRSEASATNPYPESGLLEFRGTVVPIATLDGIRDRLRADLRIAPREVLAYLEALLDHVSWQIAEMEPDPDERATFVSGRELNAAYPSQRHANVAAFDCFRLFRELMDLFDEARAAVAAPRQRLPVLVGLSEGRSPGAW